MGTAFTSLLSLQLLLCPASTLKFTTSPSLVIVAYTHSRRDTQKHTCVYKHTACWVPSVLLLCTCVQSCPLGLDNLTGARPGRRLRLPPTAVMNCLSSFFSNCPSDSFPFANFSQQSRHIWGELFCQGVYNQILLKRIHYGTSLNTPHGLYLKEWASLSTSASFMCLCTFECAGTDMYTYVYIHMHIHCEVLPKLRDFCF